MIPLLTLLHYLSLISALVMLALLVWHYGREVKKRWRGAGRDS